MSAARDDVIVVVPSRPPRWVGEAIAALARALGHPLPARVEEAAATPPAGAVPRLYAELDRRRFAEPDGPLAPIEPDRLAPHLSVGPELPSGARLALSFVGREAAVGLASRAEVALWLEMAAPGAAWLGLDEVARGEPLVRSGLLRVGREGGPDAVVAEHRSRAHALSFHRTREVHAAKLPALVVRTALALLSGAPAAELRTAGGAPGAGATSGPAPSPGARTIVRLAASALARRAAALGRERATRRRWFVALTHREGALDRILAGSSPDGLRWLDPPHDRFWADPFPAPLPEGHAVFVEEYMYDRGRARIACFTVRKGLPVGEPVPVLEEPHHLSYPFVFRWNGDWYMLPEASESGGLVLYRARDFPLAWEPVGPMRGVGAAVDATLVRHAGRWWLFAVLQGARSEAWDEDLHIFHAATPLGPWTPHPANPVRVDACGARPAGPFIRRGARLYRPGQDCSASYGRAIVLHEVVELGPERFRERRVSRIEPDWRRGLRGTHTIAGAPGLLVLDGVRRHLGRWPLP